MLGLPERKCHSVHGVCAVWENREDIVVGNLVEFEQLIGAHYAAENLCVELMCQISQIGIVVKVTMCQNDIIRTGYIISCEAVKLAVNKIRIHQNDLSVRKHDFVVGSAIIGTHLKAISHDDLPFIGCVWLHSLQQLSLF